MNPDTYKGKKAFITGGSAGIGKALAKQLVDAGAHVVICARGQEKLDETVAELKAAAKDQSLVVASVSADVTDAPAMEAAAKRAIELLGGLDVVIANAGYANCCAVAKADDDHFRRLMEVNYFGQVNTVRPFLAHFAAQKSGEIVLVASTLAIFSVWGYGAYSASKFALRGFAEALRQEMLLYDVRVKLFLPPTTDTPGLERENAEKPPIIHEMEMGSSLNKTHPAEKVAAALLQWLPKKRFVGYATFDTWFQYFAARHFPNLALKIADSEMFKAIKRLDAKGAAVDARA